MTIYDYIASKNPSGTNKLLDNYGFDNTSNTKTLSERLKAIVRKYKKIALQDISLIHPDKALLDSFTTSNFDESEFAYANGVRSPEFMEQPVEAPPAKDTGFIPPLPVTPTQPAIPPKVLEVMKELKQQVKINKNARLRLERKEMEKLNMANISGFNQTNLLMCAVTFALGYMIAKNTK